MASAGLAEDRASRWRISAPCADESLRSVLNRAADLYAQPPATLWAQLLDEEGVPPCAIDAPSAEALAALARALEVRPARVARLGLPGSKWCLANGPRQPYCPRCWRADDAAGRPRHFRRAWARALALRCDVHATPLVAWHATHHQFSPRTGDDISLPELLIDVIDTQPSVREALALIHDFVDRFAACLEGEAAWPCAWNGSRDDAIETVVHVITPDGPAESSWLSQTYTHPALRPFIHPGPHHPEAGSSEGWERLQRTGDPATRRMVLWLVGSWVVPTWPDRFRVPLPRP
jgi:hypothetical protein